mgnify:CR=1 FL=1
MELKEYFKIIRDGSRQAQGALRSLAIEQTKLQNKLMNELSNKYKDGFLDKVKETYDSVKKEQENNK